MRRASHALLTLALGLVPLAAIAQDAADSGQVVPRDYGVGNVNILQIPAPAFQPMLTGSWTFDANFYLYSGAAAAVYALAPVQLPTGAKITNIGLYYDDTDAVNDVIAYLYELPGFNASASKNLLAQAGSSGSPGKGYVASSAISYTVNNSVHTGGGAQLIVELYAGSAATKFKSVDIVWQRQIAPAPAVATFLDVPTSHPFFATIEALAKSGITSGCGNGNFCPNQTLTRQEVAKFLTRAFGLYWPDVGP